MIEVLSVVDSRQHAAMSVAAVTGGCEYLLNMEINGTPCMGFVGLCSADSVLG